eukprot:CAMPEP_0116833448 /NCGR_PEP_ID=MMETSP0418-20121206/6443_1 /TAXON_ID=1158023 /ORGANISM="Astrosyne radiata, Strain 13vi08-1A" /LENGTH=121 /DNA_ID=CAMNT_0004462901 /DNA_START=102 /DNA_END=467 /DNA_ORIENTATION=+
MKVDVEGMECNALKGSLGFLQSISILYVTMEWSKVRLERQHCRYREELFDLFQRHQLEPYIYHFWEKEKKWVAEDVTQWQTWGEEVAEKLFDIIWSRQPPNMTLFGKNDDSDSDAIFKRRR